MLRLIHGKNPTASPHTIEGTQERILSSDEVLSVLSQYADGYTFGRELSDHKGVYLRELEVEGETLGETIEYQYVRKGDHGNQIASLRTMISVIYYDDGKPVGGSVLAVLDEETGEWKGQ